MTEGRRWLRNVRIEVAIVDRSTGNVERTLALSDLAIRFHAMKRWFGRVPNSATIEVWNLAGRTRAEIAEFGGVVRLWAGHGETEQLIYAGDVLNAHSRHEGADWLTTLNCGTATWELRNRVETRNFAEGTAPHTILDRLARDFWDGEIRIHGADALPLTKSSMALPFKVWRALDEVCSTYGLNWSVIDGVLVIADPDFETDDDAIEISPQTGMIGSPVITDSGVEVELLMNPAILPYRKVVVVSSAPQYSLSNEAFVPQTTVDRKAIRGNYVVKFVRHLGENFGPRWVTRLSLLHKGGDET